MVARRVDAAFWEALISWRRSSARLWRPTPRNTDLDPAKRDRRTRRRAADELANARDRALVERAVAGDLDAFNQLVALYQDYLFSLVVRVVNDRDSAADAVQEAFFSCYRNIHRFRGDSFRCG